MSTTNGKRGSWFGPSAGRRYPRCDWLLLRGMLKGRQIDQLKSVLSFIVCKKIVTFIASTVLIRSGKWSICATLLLLYFNHILSRHLKVEYLSLCRKLYQNKLIGRLLRAQGFPKIKDLTPHDG